MTVVHDPSGNPLEFPDDMSMDAIADVMRKQFPTAPKRPGNETLNSINDALSAPQGAFDANFIPGGQYAMAGAKWLGDSIAHPIDRINGNALSYEDELKSVNADRKSFSDAHPIVSGAMSTAGMLTNPIYNKVAGLLGAAVPGTGAAAQYARYGTQGAGVGAMGGLLDSTGSDGGFPTPEEAAKNTGVGAGIGLLTGVALPPLAKVAGWAGDKIGAVAQTMWDKLPYAQEGAVGRSLAKTVLGDDGLTADLLEANKGRLGSGANLVDSAGTQDPASGVWLGGKNTYRAADSLANSPGPTQDLAERTLKPRPSQGGVDIVDSAARNLAPADSFFKTLDDIATRQTKEASPHFSAAFKANPSISDPAIDRVLKTPAGKEAMSYALEQTQNRMSKMAKPDPELTAQWQELVDQGKEAAMPGGVASGLKLQSLDLMRQDLGQQLARKRIQVATGNAKPGEVATLSELYGDFRNALVKNDVTAKAGPNSMKAAGGEYEQGLNKAAALHDLNDAAEAGRDFMRGDRQTTAKDFNALSDSEKEVFRHGAALEIQKAIERTGTVPASLKNILNPANGQRKLMGTIFPNFDGFLNDVAATVRKGQAVRMIGGSDTAARLNNAPDIGSDLGGAMVDFGMGNHLSGAKGLLSGVKNWLTKPSAAAQAELGRLLLDPNAHAEAVGLLRQRATMPRGGLLGTPDLLTGPERYAAGGNLLGP